MTHTWHCTCQIYYENNHNYKCLKHLRMHETTADEDGICDQCGHYAIAISDYEIFPRNTVRKSTDIFGYRPVTPNILKWREEGLGQTMKRLYFSENEVALDWSEKPCFVDNLLQDAAKERRNKK